MADEPKKSLFTPPPAKAWDLHMMHRDARKVREHVGEIIKEISSEEDHTNALRKLKELTMKVIKTYNDLQNERQWDSSTSRKRFMNSEKRKSIEWLNSAATEIQRKMNKLDEKEPIGWKTPVKQGRVVRKAALKTRTL